MDDVQREALLEYDKNNEADLIDGLVSDIDIKPIIKKVRQFALINEVNNISYVNRRFCQLFGKIVNARKLN
ncbi:hypothetical protein HW132_34425 [Brasilonema sp. CT11]|nr:hypothetical protein [Brasilonema sp. CT11]